MGEVVAISEARKARRTTDVPMPERFSIAERLELLHWAMNKGFTLEEMTFGIESVRGWWESRRQMRSDWAAVVKNAMRRGWALKGFAQDAKRNPRLCTLNPTTGEVVIRRTIITAEMIERWMK